MWGYLVLKDTDWLPWYMGGLQNGNYSNMFANIPFNESPKGVFDFYMYTIGYHFGGLFKHVI